MCFMYVHIVHEDFPVVFAGFPPNFPTKKSTAGCGSGVARLVAAGVGFLPRDDRLGTGWKQAAGGRGGGLVCWDLKN